MRWLSEAGACGAELHGRVYTLRVGRVQGCWDERIQDERTRERCYPGRVGRCCRQRVRTRWKLERHDAIRVKAGRGEAVESDEGAVEQQAIHPARDQGRTEQDAALRAVGRTRRFIRKRAAA